MKNSKDVSKNMRVSGRGEEVVRVGKGCREIPGCWFRSNVLIWGCVLWLFILQPFLRLSIYVVFSLLYFLYLYYTAQ